MLLIIIKVIILVVVWAFLGFLAAIVNNWLVKKKFFDSPFIEENLLGLFLKLGAMALFIVIVQILYEIVSTIVFTIFKPLVVPIHNKMVAYLKSMK